MKPYKADWRKADQYPPLGCKDADRLAWEFLRRNKDYAEQYSAIQKLKEGEFENGVGKNSESLLLATECNPKALRNETGLKYSQRMLKKGQEGKIAKPSVVFQSRWSLLEPVSPDQSYNPDIVKFIIHQVMVKRPSAIERQSFKLSLAENEIMLRFRLDMNFAPQLVSAYSRLEEEATKYHDTAQKSKKLLNSKKDGVSKMAHIWLRCYDAYSEPDQYVDDPIRKRKRLSGPSAIKEQFLSEAPFLHDDPRAKANEKNPPDWNDRAADYIEQKHYLRLLLPQHTKKDLRVLTDAMHKLAKATALL